MTDHADRQRLLIEGNYPSLAKANEHDWLAWVDRNYPYSAAYEQKLTRRHTRPQPGSMHELLDLCGIRDRKQAAGLARLWFYLGTKQYERNLGRAG
jgi:hypothetical protein